MMTCAAANGKSPPSSPIPLSWMMRYDARGGAINQRAPILSLDNVLKERARSLKLEAIEVKTP
jgi:hypothetical protein